MQDQNAFNTTQFPGEQYYYSKNDISTSIYYFNKALINAKKAALPSIVIDSYSRLPGIFVEHQIWD